MERKKSRIIAGCIALVLVAAVVVIAVFFGKDRIRATSMRLLRIEGVVTLTSGGKTKTIVDNLKLSSGDVLTTEKDSLASIALDDSKAVTLQENSSAEFIKNGKMLELNLTAGALFFEVSKKLEDDESFQIRTSTMMVGIRGTSGYVFVQKDGQDGVLLTTGNVNVEGINKKTGETKEKNVTAGQVVYVYLYDEEVGNSVDFELHDAHEQELPKEVVNYLIEHEELLEDVCKATGWEKEKIEDRAEQIKKEEAQKQKESETGTGTEEETGTEQESETKDSSGKSSGSDVTDPEETETDETEETGETEETEETSEPEETEASAGNEEPGGNETPSGTPTPVPGITPTSVPTPGLPPTPAVSPTAVPTKEPTSVPRLTITTGPAPSATSAPSFTPVPSPTPVNTPVPTKSPTAVPTKSPTSIPGESPTAVPTKFPTAVPSKSPTAGPTTPPSPSPSVVPKDLPKSINMANELRIYQGSVHTLEVEIDPEAASDATITWHSDDPSVVTVSDGVITGVGEGETTVYATVTGANGPITAECIVNVIKPLELTVSPSTTGYLYVPPSDGTSDQDSWFSEQRIDVEVTYSYMEEVDPVIYLELGDARSFVEPDPEDSMLLDVTDLGGQGAFTLEPQKMNILFYENDYEYTIYVVIKSLSGREMARKPITVNLQAPG